MWGNWNPNVLLVRIQMGQLPWKQAAALPKLIRGLPDDQTTPLLDIYPRGLKTYHYAKMSIYIFVALFTITTRWKLPSNHQLMNG